MLKKSLLILILLTLTIVLVSCTNGPRSDKKPFDPNENVLKEDFIYEDLLFEDSKIEEQLYEIYLEEKQLVEDVIRNTLLMEDIIEEIILLETFYIPVDDPYKYFDGAAGKALFGDNLDLSSLISKGAIGAGCILTVAVISVTPFSSPISVAVITVAKNALPYAVKGATVGTIMGAGIGGTLGFTDALDSSQRVTALTQLGLSTAFLITAVVFPPLGGTAYATWGLITAITASSAGLVYSGVNAYNVFTRTDNIDIQIDNLNWDNLGYTIAEKAIRGASNGFVIGAISGAVLGGAQSFHKVNGKTVLIDNSTFNPTFTDSIGRTNIERMNAGLAPIGHDGYPVNIHHLDQTNNGAVVEMMQSVHRSNYFKIHSNTGQYPSDIDRPLFNIWRTQYRMWRGSRFV